MSRPPFGVHAKSIIQGEVETEQIANGEAVHNGYKARKVRTVDLRELLDKCSRVDYLHMDIQGATGGV